MLKRMICNKELIVRQVVDVRSSSVVRYEIQRASKGSDYKYARQKIIQIGKSTQQ